MDDVSLATVALQAAFGDVFVYNFDALDMQGSPDLDRKRSLANLFRITVF